MILTFLPRDDRPAIQLTFCRDSDSGFEGKGVKMCCLNVL